MKFLSIFFILILSFSLFAVEEDSNSLGQNAHVHIELSDEDSTIGDDSQFASSEEGVHSSKTEMESEELLEEEALMKFVLEEVIPAFGGFQDILFSHKPSFDIHWTSAGMQVRNCSFTFQLKQLRTIRYNLADIALYGFQSNAEIGEPRLLFLQVSCGETDHATNKTKFNIKFFVTDEEETPSHYSLKIKTMDKEQFDMKLWSIQMDVEIETVDSILISDTSSYVEILSNESPFLQFFEEDKAYAEIVEDEEEDQDAKKEEPVQNMYDIPLNVWDQMRGITETRPEGSLVPLKKMNIEQVITVQGLAEISLPVYKDGVREDTRIEIPVSGSVFSSVDGEVIPVIDISTK